MFLQGAKRNQKCGVERQPETGQDPYASEPHTRASIAEPSELKLFQSNSVRAPRRNGTKLPDFRQVGNPSARQRCPADPWAGQDSGPPRNHLSRGRANGKIFIAFRLWRVKRFATEGLGEIALN